MFASACSEKGKLGESCILVPKIYIFFFIRDSFCVNGFVSSRISVGSKLCLSGFYSLLICCFFLLHAFFYWYVYKLLIYVLLSVVKWHFIEHAYEM